MGLFRLLLRERRPDFGNNGFTEEGIWSNSDHEEAADVLRYLF